VLPCFEAVLPLGSTVAIENNKEVIVMDDDTRQELLSNCWKHAKNKNIPVEQALNWFSKRVDCKSQSNDVLLQCRVCSEPRGNKNWEIELLFKSEENCNRRWKTGYFACHLSKDFTTYSITLGEREFWFDQYQTALNFFQLRQKEENLSG